MSAPYQYSAPPPGTMGYAAPAARPAGAFDLDELLGTRAPPPPPPPPPPAPPQQQPAYTPNDDPFGFGAAPPPPPAPTTPAWQQQQQQPPQQQPPQWAPQQAAQYQQPPQQQQPPAATAYPTPVQAAPYTAPQPQSPQYQLQYQAAPQPGQPFQSAPLTPQQPQQPQPNPPMDRWNPYYTQQQQPQQPQQQPQPPQQLQQPQQPQQLQQPQQPQQLQQPQQPQQLQQPQVATLPPPPQPTTGMPPQSIPYVYSAPPLAYPTPAPYTTAPVPQAIPTGQVLAPAQPELSPQRQGSSQFTAYMQPGAPQQAPYSASPQLQQQQVPTYAAVTATAYPGQQQQPMVPSPQPSYNEDQDRANLERIRRLREQLEREQAAEAAALAGRGATVQPTGTVATTGLTAPSDGWQCRTCTFKNALSATACQMCDEARPGYSKPTPGQQRQPPAQGVVQAQVISATPSTAGGDWTCEMCQGRNVAMSGICKICNSPRPMNQPPPPQPPQQQQGVPPNVWACTNCTLHNPVSLMRCQACDYMRPGAPSRNAQSMAPPPPSVPPPPPTVNVPRNWNCTTCTFENKVEAATCTMCETPRPKHLSDAIAQQQRAQAAVPATTTLPFEASVNGRRLTPEEQERLVRQQAQILEAIQRQQQTGANTSANAGRTAPAGRQPAATTIDDSDDDDDAEEPVQWQKDTDAKNCTKCSNPFGMFLRRHHCRVCGFVFCKNCCGNFMTLKTGGKTERVCNDCHKEKTNPAPVTTAKLSRPTVSAGYPAQQPQRPATVAPSMVPCDCVAAAEGFHRPGCHNNSLAAFL